MLFRRCLLFAAAVCVSVSVALPLTTAGDDSLALRDECAGLAARAPTAQDRANAVLKAQCKKPIAAQKKAQANKKITDKVPRPKTAGFSKMNPDQRAEADKANTKAHGKAKDQAISAAQKKAKDDRKAYWESKPVTTPKGTTPNAPKPKMTKDEKAKQKSETSATLRDAAHRMQNTENIPGRQEAYKVGGNTYTGTNIRAGVMSSHLNAANPIGRNPDNRHPKDFQNLPYKADHPVESLRGKQPIPGNPTGLKEYPVTKGSWNGGSSSVGPARVVTSSEGGKDKFHGVIGHDLSKGGDKDDHYLAEKIKRFFEDYEDLEF